MGVFGRRWQSGIAVSLALVFVGSAGCDGGYPLAPTRCDDWCHATQRNECREDRPSACVATCEVQAVVVDSERDCTSLWLSLLSCYQTRPNSDFVCEDGRSRPKITVCSSEREELAHCRESDAESCFRFCANLAARCPQQAVLICSEGCQVQAPSCQGLFDNYYDCLDRTAVACDGSDLFTACPTERDELNTCNAAWM